MPSERCISQQHAHRFLTHCREDIASIYSDESSGETTAPGGNGIGVRFDAAQARFSARRGMQTIFAVQVPGLSSNARMPWAPGGRASSVHYSGRGAIGGFHVTVFLGRNRHRRYGRITKKKSPILLPNRLKPCAPHDFRLRELRTHMAQRLASVSRRESQSNISVPSNEAKADTIALLRAGSAGDTTHSDNS